MPAFSIVPSTSSTVMASNIANVRLAVTNDVETIDPGAGLMSADASLLGLLRQTLDVASRLASAIADTPAAFPAFDALLGDMQTDLFFIVASPERTIAAAQINVDYLYRYNTCVDSILANNGLTI
jgi:hypothetical protein